MRFKGLNATQLKMIALMAMVFDHVVTVYLSHETLLGVLLRIPGRIAAPLMCYFDLSYYKATGVMWGLLLGLLALAVYKKENMFVGLKVLVIFGLCVLAVPANWNYMVVLWILTFGVFRRNKFKQMAAFFMVTFFVLLLPVLSNPAYGWSHWFQTGVLLVIPLLLTYNNTRGEKITWLKWGFYMFYPGHLVILYLIRLIVAS